MSTYYILYRSRIIINCILVVFSIFCTSAFAESKDNTRRGKQIDQDNADKIINYLTDNNFSNSVPDHNVITDGDVINIGANLTCPYICTSPEGNYYGYFVELMNAIFKVHDIEVRYTNINNDAELFKALDGNILDIAIVLTNSKINKKYTILNEFDEFVKYSVYTRNNQEFSYTDLESLSNNKIIFLSDKLPDSMEYYFGSHYLSDISRFIVPRDKYITFSQAVNVLDDNIVDIIIADDKIANFYLYHAPSLRDKVNKVGDIDDFMSIRIILSSGDSDNNETIKYLKQGLAMVKKTGQYSDLRHKYLNFK